MTPAEAVLATLRRLMPKFQFNDLDHDWYKGKDGHINGGQFIVMYDNHKYLGDMIIVDDVIRWHGIDMFVEVSMADPDCFDIIVGAILSVDRQLR